MRAAVFILSSLLPVAAWAADAPPKQQVDPNKGWYFSGKGGPSFASLNGVSATGGGTVTEDSAANVVGAFGMAAGYEWMYRKHIPLRTELEFINRTEVTYDASPLLQGTSSGALASTAQNITTMAKAYWHFPVNSDKWWPFVSGGVGWAHNTAKSQYTPAGGGAMTKTTHATDDLAWTVGAGATFKLGPDVMNDVELRYVDLGKVNWGLPASQNVEANGFGKFSATEVVFSIRYMF
jgi:opacity protein-like surface antigen